MSVFLDEQLNYLNDFRIDDSSDTIDPASEGLRAINYVLGDLQMAHCWEFTIRRQVINYYKDVKVYQLNSNFVDLIGIYEQQNFRDPFDRVSPIEYDRKMNQSADEDIIATQEINGIKTLKMNYVNTKCKRTSYLTMTSKDGNGLWVASGVASNLSSDTVVYFTRTGSVKFDATGAGSAIITNSTSTGIDLSGLNGDYAKIFDVFIPDASLLTSITWDWGTDSSHYHSVTVTKQADGRAFQNGLNKILVDVKNSTDVGTVTESSFTFSRLTLVVTGAMKSIRVAEVFAETPDPLELVYYSNDWIYNTADTLFYPRFQSTNNTNTDYGLWSGTYDWFQNVVNIGAAWQILLAMQEDDRAEKFRIRYEGADGTGGIKAEAIKKLPSKVKRRNAPSLVLPSVRRRDYYAES